MTDDAAIGTIGRRLLAVVIALLLIQIVLPAALAAQAAVR